jgi:hypothetical protein
MSLCAWWFRIFVSARGSARPKVSDVLPSLANIGFGGHGFYGAVCSFVSRHRGKGRTKVEEAAASADDDSSES